MIKAILLDVDGTLLDFAACARSSMILACGELGIPWDEGFFPVFTRINNRLWGEIEAGRLTVEELYRIRWDLIFRELGIARDGVEFEGRFLAHLEESACPVEGALELLERLAEKYILCVASNAPEEQQRRRLARAGMLDRFQHLFISGTLGAAKPSPAFFAACLARLELRPEEVLMVGDSPEADVRGGQESGLKTCWYNPDGIPAPPGLRPDHVVTRLTALADIL